MTEKYHDLTTMYDGRSLDDVVSCRMEGDTMHIRVKDEDRQGFYRRVIADNTLSDAERTQAAAELRLADVGAYFKVSGRYVGAAMRTTLDIPAENLRLPRPTILIRLPLGSGLETALVSEVAFGTRNGKPYTIMTKGKAPKVGEGRGILIHTFRTDGAEGEFFVLNLGDGNSLDDAIQTTMEHWTQAESGRDGFKGRITGVLKLVATVAFLATGQSDLLEPDILTKDKGEKWDRADGTARERMVAKAVRRGKVGWTVGGNNGREIRLPYAAREGRADGTGRGLTHSHPRNGHFHAVRYGLGKAEVKVVWYEMTIVRPDLPPGDSGRYRVA